MTDTAYSRRRCRVSALAPTPGELRVRYSLPFNDDVGGGKVIAADAELVGLGVTGTSAYFGITDQESPASLVGTGGTVDLTATALFSDSSELDVTGASTYESSDEDVATVDIDGVVTILTTGDVTITVTYTTVVAEYDIHIEDGPA